MSNFVDLKFDEKQIRDLRALALLFPKLGIQNLTVGARRALGRYRANLIQSSEAIKRTVHPDSGDIKGKGRIAASMRYKVTGKTIGEFHAEFYSESSAALGFETGERVKSKGKKFIAIPIGLAKTKTGRTKKKYRDPAVAMKAAYKIEFVPTAKGNGTFRVWEGRPIGRPKKNGSRKVKWRAIYNLVKSSKPKKKLGMMKTFDGFVPELMGRMGDAISATFWGIKLS